MNRSFVVRAATLLFASTLVALAVAYGCAKPAPEPNAAQSAPAAAQTTPSAETAASEDNKDPEPFLGATKAAVVVHPKPASSANAQQKK